MKRKRRRKRILKSEKRKRKIHKRKKKEEKSKEAKKYAQKKNGGRKGGKGRNVEKISPQLVIFLQNILKGAITFRGVQRLWNTGKIPGSAPDGGGLLQRWIPAGQN